MFTFNGIDFSTLIDVQGVERPLIAPQTISTSKSAGVAGARISRKVAEDYIISISFTIKSKNPTDLRNKVRDLADKLDTDKPAKLIFHDEPDKYQMAILSDTSELEQLGKYGICTISFYCHDPYAYAISDDIIEFKGNTKEFTRKGTAHSYPIIEIVGTNNGGAIIIQSDHQKMTFNGILNLGETLIVDSELLTAKIVGSDNTRSAIMNLDNLDFIVLHKGVNTISITPQNGATVINTKIICNSRWK